MCGMGCYCQPQVRVGCGNSEHPYLHTAVTTAVRCTAGRSYRGVPTAAVRLHWEHPAVVGGSPAVVGHVRVVRRQGTRAGRRGCPTCRTVWDQVPVPVKAHTRSPRASLLQCITRNQSACFHSVNRTS